MVKNVYATSAAEAPPLSAALIARRKREAADKQAAALQARRESKNKPRCPFETKRKGHQCRDLSCWQSELFAHGQPMGEVCQNTCVDYYCNKVHDRQARAHNVAAHKNAMAVKRQQHKNQAQYKNQQNLQAIKNSPCRFGKRCCRQDCLRQHPEGYLGPCSKMHHCANQPALWKKDSKNAKCLKAHPPFEIIGLCPRCNSLVTIPNTREPLGC